MSVRILLLVVVGFINCASCQTTDFDVVQENNIQPHVSPKAQQDSNWAKVEGLPKFNVKLHSDGCSGGMSSIYAQLKFLHKKHGKTLEWRQCCEIHDEAYYYGGSKEQKKTADEKLGVCVTKVVGSQFFGKTMQIAVKIGGGPYLPTPYRWGYGEDFRED